MEKGTEVWIVAGDFHVPAHSVKALDALLELIRDLKPDGMVINGDLMDFYELSRHNKQSLKKLENQRLETSRIEGRKVLAQLRKALGKKAKMKFIRGNHDDLLTSRFLKDGDNAIFEGSELFDISKFLGFEEYGVELVSGAWPKGKMKLGKLWITHGQYTGESCAKKHVDKYKACVMFNHLHTPQVYHASSIDGQVVGICNGHMADEEKYSQQNFDYLATPNSHVQGFSIVYVRPNGEFCAQQVNFWNGVFFYGNRQYGK
jgi:DNA repair exonuclease SbcCD nuclease subunit